jgi:hypothetical protein
MKKGRICAVYVDDTIFTGPEVALLEQEIKSLGVTSDECHQSFQLRDKRELGDFLGIGIEHRRRTPFS